MQKNYSLDSLRKDNQNQGNLRDQLRKEVLTVLQKSYTRDSSSIKSNSLSNHSSFTYKNQIPSESAKNQKLNSFQLTFSQTLKKETQSESCLHSSSSSQIWKDYRNKMNMKSAWNANSNQAPKYSKIFKERNQTQKNIETQQEPKEDIFKNELQKFKTQIQTPNFHFKKATKDLKSYISQQNSQKLAQKEELKEK